MGSVIRKGKKAFVTRSQLFPCVEARDLDACVQRRRRHWSGQSRSRDHDAHSDANFSVIRSV